MNYNDTLHKISTTFAKCLTDKTPVRRQNVNFTTDTACLEIDVRGMVYVFVAKAEPVNTGGSYVAQPGISVARYDRAGDTSAMPCIEEKNNMIRVFSGEGEQPTSNDNMPRTAILLPASRPFFLSIKTRGDDLAIIRTSDAKSKGNAGLTHLATFGKSSVVVTADQLQAVVQDEASLYVMHSGAVKNRGVVQVFGDGALAVREKGCVGEQKIMPHRGAINSSTGSWAYHL